MQPEEAQAKPKAQNALHDPAIAGPREEVQREAVLERRREGRVLVVIAPHGDTGKNLLLSLQNMNELTKCFWHQIATLTSSDVRGIWRNF